MGNNQSTSFCFFSSYWWVAGCGWWPPSGFLLPLLHPAAHQPQVDPSCSRTVLIQLMWQTRRQTAGTHLLILNDFLFFWRLVLHSLTMKFNQTERSTCCKCTLGVTFPFPFLSSGECSGCQRAVTTPAFKGYCGSTESGEGEWSQTPQESTFGCFL